MRQKIRAHLERRQEFSRELRSGVPVHELVQRYPFIRPRRLVLRQQLRRAS